MELIDTVLIERIRKALIKRYDRDQQIQQMIEEIGAEEGLNESETGYRLPSLFRGKGTSILYIYSR